MKKQGQVYQYASTYASLPMTLELADGIDRSLVDGKFDAFGSTIMFGAVAKLLAGECSCFELNRAGHVSFEPRNVQAIISGSFAPLHEGHLGLAHAARMYLDRPVVFEISVTHAYKPPLDALTLCNRLGQFYRLPSVLACAATTFDEKSRLFPGSVFVVGYDTAERMIDPRYHGSDRSALFAAFFRIRERGNSFLVAGRVDERGVFREAASLLIPEELNGLFQFIPGHIFRRDISSSAIRSQVAKLRLHD